MGANHRRALWMLLPPSFLPPSHQLQDIFLEIGDPRASLGTYHPFEKVSGALCQTSQSWIYRQSPRNILRRGNILPG